MSAAKTLRSLGVGDVVDVIQTFRVVDKTDEFIAFDDVQESAYAPSLLLSFNNQLGSVRIGIVKKAAKPKPKVGDVLSGAEIREHQWKRGTMISCVPHSPDHAIVLFADGDLHGVGSIDGFGSEPFGFDELDPDADFTILYLP